MPSISAMLASNAACSPPDACTRYLRRKAVKPSADSQRATSTPSWSQAWIVQPPPGTTITPIPFGSPCAG